jgi:DNA-binding transcriptional ArsR family regulator
VTVSMRVMSAGDGYKYLLRTVAVVDGERSLSTPLTRYYSAQGTPPGRWMGGGLLGCLSARRGLSQPTVSHYLKVLTDAGFLGRSKRGTWAYYALVPGALDPSPRCSSPHEFRFATHRCQVFRVVFRRN